MRSGEIHSLLGEIEKILDHLVESSISNDASVLDRLGDSGDNRRLRSILLSVRNERPRGRVDLGVGDVGSKREGFGSSNDG